MTRKTTLVIFEQFPEKTRFFIVDPDSEHLNAALVAAGDAPSMEAMEQFVKLVDHGQLQEHDDGGYGVIEGNNGPYDAFDRVIVVSYDG